MIRVITIEREYGSGGGDIAAAVAARLGWKLWDQLLTEEIARRMDCERRAVEEHEEKRDPVHSRLLKAFMRGSFEGSLNARALKWWTPIVCAKWFGRFCPKSPKRATA